MLRERTKRWVSRLTCGCLLLGLSSVGLAQRAYVSGKPIAVYDTSSAIPAALGNIDIDYYVEDLAVSPDGGTLYAVAAQGNTGYLLAINPRATDASSNPPAAIVGKVGIGSAPFGGLALSADGKTAYVSNFGEGSVYIVDVSAAPQVSADIGLCAGTDGIALSADGTIAYVMCRNASDIGVIGTTGPSATVISAPLGGSQIAGAGNAFYATYPGNARIDLLGAGTSIALPSGPAGIAVSPSGKTLYATLFRGMGVVGGFVPIDITTPSGTVGTPIDVGRNPMGVSVSSDGNYAYVANYDAASGASGGSVSVVDTTAASVIATLSAGINPTMVALGVTPPPLAPSATKVTLDVSSASVGQAVTANVTVTSPTRGIGGPSIPPSGNVLVSEGSATCTASLNPAGAGMSTGVCTLNLVDCGSSPCTVSANYAGDTVYNSSAGTAPIAVIPGLTLAFASPTIPEGATALLSVTLTNASSSDVHVPSLKVTASANLSALTTVSNDCGGSVGLTPTQVIFSDGVIGLSSTCTIVVGTTSTTPATYTFTVAAGDFQTSAGNNASAISTDLVVVAPIPPTLALSFAPSNIVAGGVSTLTLTLENANTTPLLLGSLVDTLPSGVVIADPASATTDCPNAAVSASPGGTSLLVANSSAGFVTSTIPAQGSCAASVAVTSTTPGSYTNTIAAGALQTQTTSPPDSLLIGLTDNNVSAIDATMNVSAAPPIPTSIVLSASPNPASVGQSINASVSVVGPATPTALRQAPSANAAATPTGTVSIGDGVTSCTASLANGSGSCALSFASAGTHVLTAVYSGDGNYAASSATLNEVVNAVPAPTTSAVSAPALGLRGLLVLLLSVCAIGALRHWRPR